MGNVGKGGREGAGKGRRGVRVEWKGGIVVGVEAEGREARCWV